MLKTLENLRQIPQLKDSLSYIYIEHAVIEQEAYSIAMITKDGRTPIPIANVTCLLLGPGTTITHAAIKALSECGCMIIWCGENIRKYYAVGKGETGSAKNILKQVKLVCNPDLHIQVVRRMYLLRFPEFKQSNYTIKQLRGAEGIRVKQAYQTASKIYKVPWKGRNYKIKDIDASDDINRALTIAFDLLYNICHAAIISLGYSPALGFIHTGKMESFVYDVADFYKVEIAIPAAFEAVASNVSNLDETVRKNCRKRFVTMQLLKRIAQDIESVFDVIEYTDENGLYNEGQIISSGVNYSSEIEG